jgi:hypothetical protein
MGEEPGGTADINFRMLKDYDYSPLHYRLMHAMVQPALETE